MIGGDGSERRRPAGGAGVQARNKNSCRAALLATFVTLVVAVAPPSTAKSALPRTEMRYAVSAHPDDEPVAWTMIERRPQTYTVFVLLTQGEQTDFCMSPEEVPAERAKGDPGEANGRITEGFELYSLNNAGPWGYQGPDSPVGEPDKGERRPFGNPWQGKGTQACKDARVASWHWFLDDMAADDLSTADMGVAENPYLAATYRGRFCKGAGSLGCARVWADEDGARVVFDIGDLQLSKGEVVRALDLVRDRRERWGIPTLPEAGVLAAVPNGPPCAPHLDHFAVVDAVYDHDFDAGPQWGVACDTADPRFQESPGPVMPFDPVDLRMNMIDPETERRQGTYVVNYGWLYDTYNWGGSVGTYWERFG